MAHHPHTSVSCGCSHVAQDDVTVHGQRWPVVKHCHMLCAAVSRLGDQEPLHASGAEHLPRPYTKEMEAMIRDVQRPQALAMLTIAPEVPNSQVFPEHPCLHRDPCPDPTTTTTIIRTH